MQWAGATPCCRVWASHSKWLLQWSTSSRGYFCTDPEPLNSTSSSLRSLSVVLSAIRRFWWGFQIESWWWGFFVLCVWSKFNLRRNGGIFQFSSVTQPCSTVCYSVDCSTPGFPVHHQLPELAQTGMIEPGFGWNALKHWFSICWLHIPVTWKDLKYQSPPYQRRQWHPTPVLLPGKSHGRRSLVGCSPWGR